MPFDKLSEIAGNAFDDILSQVGVDDGDPQLNIYDTLSEKDFKSLESRYGADQVDKYIKVMEAKRMGVT